MSKQAENTSNEFFRLNLSDAMKRLDWKQSDLSAASGVAQGVISNYITGRREPTASQLHRLASALDVSMEWLLTGHGQSKDGSGSETAATAKPSPNLTKALNDAQSALDRIRRETGA